ncbi:MAG: MFS transporter [Gammaproteobacteria bacterium]|nr:MFS transporter [Gammaproteobacteria bacterium]
MMLVIFLVVMSSGLGFGLILPPFMFAAEDLGASPMVAAFIISLFSLGQFVANPLWGRLSDRIGRRPVLLITIFGQMIAYIVMALADDLWILGGSRLATGLLAGNFAAAVAYVTDITPSEERAKGMGLVGGAVSIGFMIGPAMGGLLGADADGGASMFIPCLAAAGVSFVTFLGVFFFLKESHSKDMQQQAKEHQAEIGGRWSSITHVLSRPFLAQMVLMGFLVFFVMAMFETIMPLWSGARFDWGPKEVGFVFMYLGFVVMTVQLGVVGKLTPMLGEGRLLMIAVASYSVGLVIMTQAPTWHLMIVGITFTAAAGALFNTVAVSWVSRHAGEQERGTVIGVYQSFVYLGRAVGPTFSGLMFQTLGVNSPLLLGAAVLVPCFFIVVSVRRRSMHAGVSG